MKITAMNKKDNVEAQYIDDSNLNIRKRLHREYSINKQGFGQWLFEQYQLKSGDTVLELGSGNGDMWAKHIKKLSTEVEVVLSDFSEGMVDILNRDYHDYNVDIQTIDIQDIPFPDSHFDVVIANMMLYHVPDLNKGLLEVKRVLKPNGVFYAATFGENGLSEYLNKALFELDMVNDKKIEYIFTLQKGTSILSSFFDAVECYQYIDRLEISNVSDLIEYIKTMGILGGITNLDENKLRRYFESKRNENGILVIPKQYGTFIMKK